MKMPKAMMAVMLCAGLVAALGLAACGDDDEEEGLTCEEALAEFLSTDCQTQALAAVDALKTCVVACQGNGDCEDVCYEAFEDAASACLPEAEKVLTCNEDCGEDFDTCMTGAAGTGTQCLNALLACLNPA